MRILEILLVEDDIIEVMKLTRATKSLKLPHNITQAINGEEALELLKLENKSPDLILLDLNMPKMNGIEFLRILKNSDKLKAIPTIVFTTSINPKDLKDAYDIGVSGYIVKPLNYKDYVTKVDYLCKYWLINELKSR